MSHHVANIVSLTNSGSFNFGDSVSHLQVLCLQILQANYCTFALNVTLPTWKLLHAMTPQSLQSLTVPGWMPFTLGHTVLVLKFFKVGHLNKFDVNYLKDPYNWALSHLWGTDPNGRATGLPSLCAAFGFWAAYLAIFLPRGEVMIDTLTWWKEMSQGCLIRAASHSISISWKGATSSSPNAHWNHVALYCHCF